jgi:tetratricopeptide (TPR) repeat protein
MKKIIKYTIIIVLLFSFFVVPDIYAQSCSWKNYVDLPTANIPDGFFINFSGGYALASKAENVFDVNGSIEYGVAGFLVGLKVYTERDFCLDLAYQLLEQSGLVPSISLGIENITYNSYVSPLGKNGLIDELYIARPPEIASAYLVFTEAIHANIEMTLGMGRGRFVGYGPRSQYLNFDAFLDTTHENFVVGLFGGMKISTPVGASFILETDGRDANAGIQYEAGMWKGTLSVDKIEHFFAESDTLVNAPWLSLAVSFSPVGGSKRLLAKTGKLNLLIKDKESGASIPGKVIVAKGNIEKSFDVASAQKAIIELEPGNYKISVFSAGYKMKTAQIPIKARSDLDFTVSLSKVINPAIKKSMDLTKEGADYYKRGLLMLAKQKLEEALKLYPNNEKAKKGLQLVQNTFADKISDLKSKAIVRENKGDIKGAIALWEQAAALEADPSGTQKHIQYLKGKLTARKKPVTRKTTTVKKKAPAKKKALSKQQIADLYTKGLSAYFDGNYKEAVKYFEQVLSADPSHAQAKRYLGEAKKH